MRTEEEKKRIAMGWGRRLMKLGSEAVPCPGNCWYCEGDLSIKYTDDSLTMCFCSPGCGQAFVLRGAKETPGDWDDKTWEWFEDRWYCLKHKKEITNLRHKNPVITIPPGDGPDRIWACGCCGQLFENQDSIRPRVIELSCCGVWIERYMPSEGELP